MEDVPIDPRIAGRQLPHSLNSTLEIVGNLAFLAHSYADDPEEVRKYTALIQEHISALVGDILYNQN